MVREGYRITGGGLRVDRGRGYWGGGGVSRGWKEIRKIRLW